MQAEELRQIQRVVVGDDYLRGVCQRVSCGTPALAQIAVLAGDE